MLVHATATATTTNGTAWLMPLQLLIVAMTTNTALHMVLHHKCWSNCHWVLCCGVLQCMAGSCSLRAVCCSALQCDAVSQCIALRCTALQCFVVHRSTLQCVALRWSVVPYIAVRYGASLCVAVRWCSTLQCVAVHCSACTLAVCCSVLPQIPEQSKGVVRRECLGFLLILSCLSLLKMKIYY